MDNHLKHHGKFKLVEEVSIDFRNKMLEKLGTTQEKGNREGWLTATLLELQDGVREEFDELTLELDDENLNNIMSEAVDLANTAMMVWDKARELKKET